MPDKGTKKKVTRVAGGKTPAEDPKSAGKIDKKKAVTLRIFAILSWIVAIGFEVGAILELNATAANTATLIILIAAALVFAVAGSLLWKKANRWNPASEKEKFRFFIQNQLGVIISVIAFLPLVILIFTNKDLKGKQKSLVGAVAVVALIIAGVVGIDFDPPSLEQYTEQTAEVEMLNRGQNHVYWTKYGRSYHLYSDCSYINTERTDEIFEGTVSQARELKNITDLCDLCRRRAQRQNE